MEKSPLRGTLAGKTNMEESLKVSKLRGTLMDSVTSNTSAEGSALRGTLAPRPETGDISSEGRTLSLEEVPNEDALQMFVGRTFVQRDGGMNAKVEWIKDNPRTGGKSIKLHRADNARITLQGTLFHSAITTEGGAWRFLG